MTHRLWFRLALTFAVIILVTVVTIYFFVSQRIAVEMEYYRTISAQYRSVQIRSNLYLHYLDKGNWEGVQSVVDALGVSGTRIILVGANGTVVADSKREFPVGTNYTDSSGSPLELTLRTQNLTQNLGKVYIGSDPAAEPYVAPFLRLSTSINRSLLLGGALGNRRAMPITRDTPQRRERIIEL